MNKDFILKGNDRVFYRDMFGINCFHVVSFVHIDELDSADNYIAKIYKENQQLKEQQKEFINYLKSMLSSEKDNFSVARVKDILEKYKEIVGDK